MTAGRNTLKYLDNILYILYIIFFVTLICSFRWVSSFILGLILITGLAKNKIEKGSFFNKKLKNTFILTCCIYYVFEAASLLHTNNFAESLKHLRIKSGLILIPFLLCCNGYVNSLTVRKLMKHYIWIVGAAMVFCLAIAVRNYFLHGQNEVFFYHELVSPFMQNAVQVSILLFIALIYLLDTGRKRFYFNNKFFHFLLILYFIFCILLLSSKLVIIFLACILIYFFITSFKKKQKIFTITSIVTCLVIIVVLLTDNPVSKRFNEIISGNMSIVHQENFSPATYFNGLQFRVLQWRFVSEILTENNAWLMGVSPGDAQTLLNNKYISTNMYVGEARNGGFLGYNTHNQFLQSILQTGILGLLSFIAICYSMVQLAMLRKSIVLTSIVLLLIAYALNDSSLESQYGIVLFTFFPLLFYLGTETKFRPLQKI